MHLAAPAGNRPCLHAEREYLNFSAAPGLRQARRVLQPAGTRRGQPPVVSSVRSASVAAIARWLRRFETGSARCPPRLATPPHSATSAASLADSVAQHPDQPGLSPAHCAWSAIRLLCHRFPQRCYRLLRPSIAPRLELPATAHWHLPVAPAIARALPMNPAAHKSFSPWWP